MTPRQCQAMALIGGPARHIMLFGGSRSGKTSIACRAVASRANQAPGSRHILLRQHFNHAKAALWHDTFPKMMRMFFPDVRYESNRSDWFWRFPNGSEIWIGGVDDEDRAEKILGQEYLTILMSEASQNHFATRELVRTRLAQHIIVNGKAVRLKFLYDMNPPGSQHWTHRLWIEGRSPEPPFDKLPDPEDYASLLMNPGDNKQNLSPEYLEELQKLSPRQRLRFWEGRFGDATENALWTREGIETDRRKAYPDLVRVVVAIDPSGTKGPGDNHDAVGIVVAGVGTDGHAYVLEDDSIKAPPEVWGRVAVSAYSRHMADGIVAEVNFGGALVEAVIKAAAAELEVPFSYREVHASRGKVIRAEPISQLYAQHKVHHIGRHDELEDQLTSFTTNGYIGTGSPDRADACIWALSDLFPGMTKVRREERPLIIQGLANYSPHDGYREGN